jgi:hypothetical protein
MANGAVGVLEAASGQRISLPNNNSSPQAVTPNDADPAQKIQFLQVSGNQYVLQRANTNYSLSSNTLDYVTANLPGMGMTTYNTGAGRWQNFGFVNSGVAGFFNIKYAWNPDYFLSAGSGSGSIGYIVPCNASDSKQRFKTESLTSVIITQRYNYAVIGSGNATNISSPHFLGHSWTGVLKLVKSTKQYFKNGVYQSSDIPTYQYETMSLSSWPNRTSYPVINGADDIKLVNDYFNGVVNSYYTTRLYAITDTDYYNATTTLKNQTGCTSYPNDLYLGVAFSGQCNCTQAAVAYWKLVTNESLLLPSDLATPAILKLNILGKQNQSSTNFTRP